MTATLVTGLEAAGERLAVASIVAALMALALALLLRLVPSLPPALRAGLWWLVAARTLVELTGAPALELAVLPKPAIVVGSAAEAPAVVVPDLEPARPGPLALVALVAWPLGLCALALGLRQAAGVRRMVRGASAVEDPDLLERLERIRSRLGVRRRVALVQSPRADTPQVVGLLRPTVVLPEPSGLDAEELDWALAHELAHVRRRDSLWSIVPFAAERFLVFHPLVRYAAREYALAAEAACDAVVLARCASSAERYGRLLVRLAARPRAPAPAGAWPLARRPLERRLDMLARSPVPRRRTGIALGAAALLALALAVPVRLVAQSQAPPPPPEAPEAPEEPEAPALSPVAPSPARPPRVAMPAMPVVAPSAPIAPVVGMRWTEAARAPRAPRPPAPIRIAPSPVTLSVLPVDAARVADEAVRSALDASRRAVEEARRAAEIAAEQVERAHRIAESSRRRAEQVSRQVAESRAEHQQELETTMAQFQRQLAGLQRELERTQAELAETFGAGMERAWAEMAEEMARRRIEMREMEEQFERELDLEAGELPGLGEELELDVEPDIAPRADPPR